MKKRRWIEVLKDMKNLIVELDHNMSCPWV